MYQRTRPDDTAESRKVLYAKGHGCSRHSGKHTGDAYGLWWCRTCAAPCHH